MLYYLCQPVERVQDNINISFRFSYEFRPFAFPTSRVYTCNFVPLTTLLYINVNSTVAVLISLLYCIVMRIYTF